MSVASYKTPILVTGATGNVGKHVASLLAESGMPVLAVSRHPTSRGESSLIRSVAADLAVPSTIVDTMGEAESMFLMVRDLMTPISPLLDMLKNRVRRVVFLSSSAIEEGTSEQSNPIGKAHLAIEEQIKRTVPEWTFLRPGAFAANAIRWWAPQLHRSNFLRWPYGEAVSNPIHERDIATVVVHCLLGKPHAGKTYSLTGARAYTQFEQLALLSQATNRNLRFVEISPDEARKELSDVLPSFVIDRLLHMWNASRGRPSLITGSVKEITGFAPRTFLQWAEEHAPDFALETVNPSS